MYKTYQPSSTLRRNASKDGLKELNDYVCHADRPVLCVKEVIAQPDYKLLLTFSNHERRLYNVAPLLKYEIFAPLKAVPFFMRAKCDGCAVFWNDDIDIAPEELYQNSIPVKS